MQNSKTLYVTDLDGTFLNRESKVSTASASLINSLIQEHDINFTVATARTPATVVPLLKEIEMRLPSVVMTGAALWNHSKEDYEEMSELSFPQVKEICHLFDEEEINPFVYMRNGNFLDVSHVENMTSPEQKFFDERKFSPFKNFILDSTPSLSKAALIFATDNLTRLKHLHKRIIDSVDCEAICYRDIFSETNGYLEIYAPKVSKAHAIKHLSERIGADRIVVFGDNLNDISMMKIATHSIAVGNAYNEVKEAADEVIGDNYQDSVARWIEKDVLSGL